MKDTNYDLTLLYTIDPELAVIASGYIFANSVNNTIENKLKKSFGEIDKKTLREIIKYCFKGIRNSE